MGMTRILSNKQIQGVLNLLGSPEFINKRQGHRTWKWYCDNERGRVAVKLVKANISIHNHDDYQITVAVPTNCFVRDWDVPKVAKALDITEAELRRRCRQRVDQMDMSELKTMAFDWNLDVRP